MAAPGRRGSRDSLQTRLARGVPATRVRPGAAARRQSRGPWSPLRTAVRRRADPADNGAAAVLEHRMFPRRMHRGRRAARSGLNASGRSRSCRRPAWPNSLPPRAGPNWTSSSRACPTMRSAIWSWRGCGPCGADWEAARRAGLAANPQRRRWSVRRGNSSPRSAAGRRCDPHRSAPLRAEGGTGSGRVVDSTRDSGLAARDSNARRGTGCGPGLPGSAVPRSCEASRLRRVRSVERRRWGRRAADGCSSSDNRRNGLANTEAPRQVSGSRQRTERR